MLNSGGGARSHLSRACFQLMARGGAVQDRRFGIPTRPKLPDQGAGTDLDTIKTADICLGSAPVKTSRGRVDGARLWRDGLMLVSRQRRRARRAQAFGMRGHQIRQWSKVGVPPEQFWTNIARGTPTKNVTFAVTELNALGLKKYPQRDRPAVPGPARTLPDEAAAALAEVEKM